MALHGCHDFRKVDKMAKYCMGIDVGGTTVKMGLFTEDGTLVDKWEIPTRKEEGGSYILSDIAVSLENKWSSASIARRSNRNRNWYSRTYYGRWNGFKMCQFRLGSI